jgi:hypothetical protein
MVLIGQHLIWAHVFCGGSPVVGGVVESISEGLVVFGRGAKRGLGIGEQD